jgi:hypothetical protein
MLVAEGCSLLLCELVGGLWQRISTFTPGAFVGDEIKSAVLDRKQKYRNLIYHKKAQNWEIEGHENFTLHFRNKFTVEPARRGNRGPLFLLPATNHNWSLNSAIQNLAATLRPQLYYFSLILETTVNLNQTSVFYAQGSEI